MELRHLKYFVAIAEERSITRAAERLWIAQPGLSTQVRRLETELGIQLFHRYTRGVELTAAGEMFLERARAALAAAEEARAIGANLEAGLVGTVRLGIAAETPARLVPSLLAAFGQDRPDVEVTVVESYSGTVLRDLRDGRLDAVLAPSSLGSGELRSLPLDAEPWVVLVGRGHRLASPDAIDVHELHGERVVVTGHRDGAGYDRAVAELLTGFGLTPVLQAGGPGPALYAAVAVGDAVALATPAAARGGQLFARPLEPARLLRHSLLWRDETPAPALGGLIRAIETGADTVRPVPRPALVSVA
jgi:DNA-binding transcriptional LysR family regulator